MPDTYTMTVSGNTLDDLRGNLRAMVDAMAAAAGPLQPAITNGEGEAPEQEQAEEVTPAPRGRGRPPKVAASQAVKGNGAAQAQLQKSTSQMRQESTDILKACWGLQPDGAERVIALQQKFGVKRFAEVGDDKIPDLYQQAVALQTELTDGTSSAAADTGPF